MKKLCSTELGGVKTDYMLDIGKRSNGYLCIKDGVITVRLPMTGSQRAAEEMLKAHESWIIEKLKQSEERSRMPQGFYSGENFSLLGRKRQLIIEHSAEYREPLLTENALTVYISPQMRESDSGRLFMCYAAALCEKCVKAAFDKYSPILGLYPKKVTLKKMTSRWGSCSSNGSISINVDVVCFEQKCIDYVVVHELCHLKHMNHGEEFWRLVASCCPDYKALRERMKH